MFRSATRTAVRDELQLVPIRPAAFTAGLPRGQAQGPRRSGLAAAAAGSPRQRLREHFLPASLPAQRVCPQGRSQKELSPEVGGVTLRPSSDAEVEASRGAKAGLTRGHGARWPEGGRGRE